MTREQRAKVKEALQSGESQRLLDAIAEWFKAYQAWERSDRFLTACKERRMVMRQAPEAAIVPDPKGNVPGLGMRGIDEPVNSANTTYANYRADMGLDGIKKRMDPANFQKKRWDGAWGKEERGKYIHGLHDLSASLFNPDKPTISEQCRWKESASETAKINKWYIVFIPIAQAEDVELFNKLNELAKRNREAPGPFEVMVAKISKEMTRIKYAQETDMGAGFVSVHHKAAGADVLPKFRYGAGNVQEVKAPGSVASVLKSVPGAAGERAKNALDYAGVLRRQTECASLSNEVIVRVRRRDGDRFPVIAKWDGKEFACHPNEPSSAYIVGKVIPNAWKDTKERD